MNRWAIIIFTILCTCININAQEKNEVISTADKTYDSNKQAYSVGNYSSKYEPMESSFLSSEPSEDSLHLPLLTDRGLMEPIGYAPLAYWHSYNTWNLHKGVNVQLGASVFASFGKNASHGAGFSQNISAMYAVPITDKWSLAIGGYYNNVYWAHDAYRNAGLSAVLGYKFDEHWEAYIYGQKAITDSKRHIPYPLYDISDMGDRIGAALKYNFNNNVSIQMSVEHRWLPNQRGAYFNQYNYPIGDNY